jgi:N utilization substance protein A
VVEVRRATKGPQVLISRTHPGLVKRLFELEVPEVYDGTVEIRSMAREAGSRTKMAVWADEPNVDPIGACVGPRGQRVNTIVEELKGEKIDIIRWSEDPSEYIAAALAPADVISVEELPARADAKSCRVVVPDDQLSLAIGKEGQNARLAAKLTGYKIDIKPASAPLEPIEDLIAQAEADAAEEALEAAMAQAEENGEIPESTEE